MKIGYVKYEIKPECINEKIRYLVYSTLNYVRKDKYKNVFYIYNKNENTMKNLQRKLQINKIDRIVCDNGINVNYNKITNRDLTKYFIPEIIKYIKQNVRMKYEQIHIVVNNATKENYEIIREISQTNKIVNIITNNKAFFEREGEKDFISVSNNKRRSLRKAEIIVNLDIKNMDDYVINKKSIIIDANNIMKTPKYFDGIIVRGVDVYTKKVLRDFCDFDGFKRNELVEAKILEISNYAEAREFIKFHKIGIIKLYNNREIKLCNSGQLKK